MASGIRFTGDWKRAAKDLGILKTELKAKLKIALSQEAHFLVGKAKAYIADPSNFKPLSPLTIKMRQLSGFGGDKPLNATGALKGAIAVVPATPSALKYFIGVPRNARGKGGGKGKPRSLYSIAQIMENGATIVMALTPKMRKFLFGVLFKGEPAQARAPHHGTGTVVIHIPPRPFITPVMEKWGKTSGQRVYDRLAKLLGGAMGSA